MVNLYPFLAYVVVTTFTPGPNNILAMSTRCITATGGPWAFWRG